MNLMHTHNVYSVQHQTEKTTTNTTLSKYKYMKSSPLDNACVCEIERDRNKSVVSEVMHAFNIFAAFDFRNSQKAYDYYYCECVLIFDVYKYLTQ